MDDPTLLIRLINGLFTLGFAPLLYSTYTKTNRRFYLIWSLGFLSYGLSICIRAVFPLLILDANLETILSGALVMLGFVTILTGLGDLVDKLKMYFLVGLMIPVLIVVIYATGAPTAYGWALGVTPYLFIAITLLFLRMRYRVDVDLLIIGWFFLLVTNIGFAFNLIASSYDEVLAISSKLVILAGVLIPRFSLLANELKQFLISGSVESYPDEKPGGFTLINSTLSREDEIKWIINRVNEKKGKQRTILITTHDLISPQEIKRQSLNNDELYVIRMVHGSQDSTILFQEKVTTINDNLTELGLLLSEIVGFSRDRKIRIEIIFYSLSTLIQMHDWRDVHKQILALMPRLKNAGVQIDAFFYPGTHEDKTIVEVFTKLADFSISLKTVY